MTSTNVLKHMARDSYMSMKPSRSIGAFQDAPTYNGTGEESYVYFRIDPKYTNYVNRILEGYEYVGVMTTIDKDGLCVVRCTPSTRPLAIEILSSLVEVQLVKDHGL